MSFLRWIKWYFWDSARCEHEQSLHWTYWDAGMVKTRHCTKCGRCLEMV